MKRRWFIPLLALPLALGFLAKWGWDFWRERRFDPQILSAARAYKTDPALVKAIVWRESGFRPDVLGRAGELGLMQIRAVAAQEWAKAEHLPAFQHQHCLDPGTNTMAATWYLQKMLKRYAKTDDPVPYALADYNAGRGNVLKWTRGPAATNSALFIEQIGFPGTKKYVQAIMHRRERYRAMTAQLPTPPL